MYVNVTSPEKVKVISLIDVKVSRFGAENLTKCGNFINLPYYIVPCHKLLITQSTASSPTN